MDTHAELADAASSLAIYRACERLIETLGRVRPDDPAELAVLRIGGRLGALLASMEPAQAAETDTHRARIAVRCLGATTVTLNGVRVDWPRRSRLVFMYLLAHRDRPVMRDELIEAFWPGSAPEKGRNCLNVALSHLRRPLRDALGSRPFVVFRSEAYQLAPGLDLQVDWHDFQAFARQADARTAAGDIRAAADSYRSAVALYGDDLFVEERYENWICPLRLATEGTLLRVLDRLSECQLQLDDHEACAATCDELLTRAPYREDIHRRLMQCYAAVGQESRAVKHYRSCEEILDRELGTAPGALTRAVYEQLVPRTAARSASTVRPALLAA